MTAPWTAADAWTLNGRAAGWMLGATLPVASVLGLLVAPLAGPSWEYTGGDWWSATGGLLGWAVLVDAVSAVFVLGSALVTVPVTWAAGKLLERVRSARVHIVATALLAGTLAAVPAALGGVDTLVVTAPVSLAAGAAGALARRGQLRQAQRQEAQRQEAQQQEAQRQEARSTQAPPGTE
ncbi:hypothetical protein [Curtobacterium sp. 'Ferrero']|uniref:hypothetical protein n=1 Tax=Curtobacterium sp. 'Ferrero' TaxID=2033654 RepID=UPI001596C222|nr:hypothetical protein [Curtobacterium sp. 'Ferrero']